MAFEVDSKTLKWMLMIKILAPNDIKQNAKSTYEVKETVSTQFQNGVKVSQIVTELYKKKGLPLPVTLNHLKLSNNTAAMLYNWNILNDALRKMDFQIDSETKNLIINGDKAHLAMVLRKLAKLYETDEYEDSLDQESMKDIQKQRQNQFKESLTLSKSEQPEKAMNLKSSGLVNNLQKMRKTENKMSMAKGDLLEFVINQLTKCLKLSRKQAVTLLSDNNKYLAHVLVKGVKGEFSQIQELLQKFYSQIDYIIERMMDQNDMCFYFLQIIKPCLLSKNEEIAQWGCRILTKIANQLANKQMLPLAYDWFVQEAGGLSTTILSLTRHPKLNQHVVGYILQFARYNVTQLFTIELKKITNNDQLSYVKFMLLIFNPLVQSKISAEELLNSGAIDYWVQITMKGAENQLTQSKELRMYCIEFLIKIWRAYPTHIQDTLDQVNNIMTALKRGIRDSSQVMRFSLMEMMFDLLDDFASKKNPYASIVYKKITFLFIENHEELTMREFMLRNIQSIFEKYPTIPVDIFLEPFIKQIKISESKSYVVNIFDMEFINVAVRHKKLKVGVGLQLFDLLAKTKLNSYSFSVFATEAMEILIDKFIHEEMFLQYTVKLVKISLAMFYSTLKQKKSNDDQERLQAQKRAQIVNMIISLIERYNEELNEEIKALVIHVKAQILNRLDIQHKGIQRILSYFTDVDEAVKEVMMNIRDQTSSNATSTAKSKSNFHLPKIQSRNMMLRDETSSQQSNMTKYSHGSRQQFPLKDYTEFVTDDEQKFLKENGLGLKKKGMTKKRGYSTEKDHIDPKIQEQIYKVKLRKEEEEKRKRKEKQYLQRKKELLKQKIQKELEQRNVKQGVKGYEKDVVAKVIFDENQINQRILEEDQDAYFKDINLMKQEERDEESVKIILRKHTPFIKKIFSRYSNLKGKKQTDQDQLSQVDLVRMCKEKNIERNKNVIIELMKNVNAKNVKSLSLQAFFKFLEALCVSVYIKQKCKTSLLMGDLMKKILRRMSQGENFKFDDDDDEICNSLTEKVRYNPHVDLPENFKKIYERNYKVNENCSYPVQKALKNKYVACYEIVNQLLKNALKINLIEEQVRFIDEARVVHKKSNYMPPKPLKKAKEESISLLEDKEVPMEKAKKPQKVSSKKNYSIEKENVQNKSRSKIVNTAEARRVQQEEEKRKKREQQEQLRKKRALEVKRKLQQQQQEMQRERERKKAQKKAQEDKEEEKKRKEKQRKQKYLKDQKQKIQKHKKEQEEKEKEQKEKMEPLKQKEEEERKQKMKEQIKKGQEKRKQEYEKMKKERELSEEKKKKKKEEEDKKKELLKKQMMKKIQDEKEKHQQGKQSKQILRKIYGEPQIQELVHGRYKQQLKAIFAYGKQFNEFKLDKDAGILQQKGWLSLCQQLSFCDTATANKIIKSHLKETNSNGFNLEDFQRTLFEMSVRRQFTIESEDYEKLRELCRDRFDKFIGSLKLPKDNQKLKGYFMNLKNQLKKKKEEMVVTGPDGKKQTWEINE